MIDEDRIRERIREATGYEPPGPGFGARPISRLRGAAATEPIGRGHGNSPLLGLVAALLGVVVVGTLIVGAHAMHLNPIHPGAPRTSSPGPRTAFEPSPAVRASSWPPGEQIPAQLAGSWSSQFGSRRIELGGFTDRLSDAGRCIPGTGFSASACGYGNVVVNGSFIYFITDECFNPWSQATAPFGYEKYSYSVTASTLVLVKATDPGQSNCGFYLQGTYYRTPTS